MRFDLFPLKGGVGTVVHRQDLNNIIYNVITRDPNKQQAINNSTL